MITRQNVSTSSGELIMNASFPTIDRSCRTVKTKQQSKKIKTVKCTKCS